METITLKIIHADLEFLKKQVIEIKENMIDAVLTHDDLQSLQEAEKNLRERKTKRLG